MDLRDDDKRTVVAVGQMLPLTDLERHPANRHPTQAKIDARAASFKLDSQLEEVEVRKRGKKYQIISGETRVLAARKLGWPKIRCKIVECDDATALRLVAVHNGERADLDPIEKAKLIECLCKPEAEGGSGSTREEAARDVGLESGDSAFNLLRLLKLPKAWQERVAAGELGQSLARLLTPITHVAPVMAALEKLWKNERDREVFESRVLLEDEIESQLRQLTRRLDEPEYFQGYGSHPCLLSEDELEGNRKALGLVTIAVPTGKGATKDVEIATNVKLYNQLQIGILKRRADEKAAKAARKVGDESKKERPKSKAEVAAAADQRERQLEAAIEAWREKVIRSEVAAAIDAAPKAKADARLMKLVFHFAADSFGVAAWNVDATGMLENLTQVKAADDGDAFLMLSSSIDPAKNPIGRCQEIAAKFCAWLLLGDDRFRGAGLSGETLDRLFLEWGGEWPAVWSKLYLKSDPLVSEFFELHRKDELESLGEELGVHLAAAKDKKTMLQMLLGRPAPLKLPKALQPAKRAKGK